MQLSQAEKSLSRWQLWKLKRVAWRNRLFAKPAFQAWAARTPFVRSIARQRAQRLFDLVAGFTYTQTLLATVESGLLDLLEKGASDVESIASETGLSPEAASRLVHASAGINLAEEVAPGLWMLGEEGAALVNNAGARAMIRHHSLLYRDLADPLALLQDDRQTPTQLSEFWRYAANGDASSEGAELVNPYSELMAASQSMVCEQVIVSYRFSGSNRVLDIGGGFGVFASALAKAQPQFDVGIFDLPGVIENTARRQAAGEVCNDIALHGGDFFRDPLPSGFDTMTLVRILHDHDDAPAQALLGKIRAALPKGGRLVIAEPMAATPGAEAMGNTYFGLYLWAMRSGRPRSAQEIEAMLRAAGFRSVRRVATSQPMIASLIVATA